MLEKKEYMQPQQLDSLAQILWDYHHLGQKLQPTDLLFVLGSNDLRVPIYAASLFHQQIAPLVLISGGIAHTTDLLRTGWEKPEAEMFAEVMMKAGVPKERLLLETQARHTGENLQLGRKLLEDQHISFQSVVLVTKPHVERRIYAMAQKQWPDKKLMITSPPLSFTEYINGPIPKEDVIHLMIGNLQRIKIYGEKGIQIPQEIPSDVWDAYESLRQAGYDKHLLTEAQIAAIH